MTFVKAKLKLEELEPGDELEILLCEGEPLENVPRSITECNAKILGIEKSGNHYLIKVKKP